MITTTKTSALLDCTAHRAALVLSSLILVIGSLVPANADPRTSTSYTIRTDALALGGGITSSASYQGLGSAGVISGLAQNTFGDELRTGFVSQLGFESIAFETLGAVSRKVHGNAGVFDVPLPLGGRLGVECRRAGLGGTYQVVVAFTTAVAIDGVSITSIDGLAGATYGVDGAVVTLDLAAVTNAQTLGITLINVNDGSTVGSIFIPMGVLLGDSNNDGSVNSGDAIQIRNRSGQAINATNFRSDFNSDGFVNSGDALIVRTRSGTSIP